MNVSVIMFISFGKCRVHILLESEKETNDIAAHLRSVRFRTGRRQLNFDEVLKPGFQLVVQFVAIGNAHVELSACG